jgi:GT2 family glycosyltransferase
MKPADLVIIFVNFRSGELLKRKVSERLEEGFTVRIVDNSGEYAGHGEVIRSNRNLGFGAGCNVALRTLDEATRVVCFCNPDVDVQADDLLKLARSLSSQPRPGLVAPALMIDGQLRARGFHYPSLAREVALALRSTAEISEGRVPSASRRLASRGRRFGTAALLAASVPALRAVGGFDERYFLYAEDLDLWHRVKARGFSTTFIPSSRAYHARGGGSPATAPQREVLRWVGVELFQFLHGGSWRAMRVVHRRAIHRLAGDAAILVKAVSGLWDAGKPPDEVAVQLRPLLESGAWLESR